MNQRKFFSLDQLHVLIGAHKQLCAQRGLNPVGDAANDLAAQLITYFTGGETEADLIRRFTH